MYRSNVSTILVAPIVLAALLWPAAPARAGLVDTGQVLQHAGARRQRRELVDFLQRKDVRHELQALGVAPGNARARVARLTDAEVARLHARVASLPAGGAVSNLDLVLIVLLVVLLV